jgi:hypothetical protein
MNSVSQIRMTAPLFLLIAMFAGPGALAQSPGIDFSGEWTDWEMLGEEDPRYQEVGDILNIPYNEAGRQAAETHNLSLWGLPEYQCRPHPMQFSWRGAGQNRIQRVVDLVSRETQMFRVERRRNFDINVWLDGRPHPPEDALHTWTGFSTGKWIGNVIEISTTHMKDGYLGMNGMPSSDRATITERWVRHGDYLFVQQTIEDPVYLEEPYLTSQVYKIDLEARLPPSPCIPVDESSLEQGAVPHFLPGTNTYFSDYVDTHGIPRQVLSDGAEKMYPEYQEKLRSYRSSN